MTPGSNVDGKFKKWILFDIFVSSFKRSKSNNNTSNVTTTDTLMLQVNNKRYNI